MNNNNINTKLKVKAALMAVPALLQAVATVNVSNNCKFFDATGQ